MKVFFLFIASLISSTALYAQKDAFFQEAQLFFATYVREGRVQYAMLTEKPEALNALYGQLKGLTPDPSDPQKFQAFYINAYNLAVIKTVVDHYPIESPMEVSGFFERKDHWIAGEKISLNTLENEKLRAKFKDPRVHFALVCGAISCPPIVPFAYTPERLNEQLERQTTLALNDPGFIVPDAEKKSVAVSEIFKWYKADFTENQSLIEFINQYRKDEFPSDYQVNYYPYNWALNDVQTSESPSNKNKIDTDPALNLQTYTAGTLLKKGQMDFTLFNTLYTETRNNWQGQTFDGYRANFATSLLQWTIGVDKNARFNVGFDLSIRGTGRAAQNTSFGAINRAFLGSNTDSSRFGVGNVGPRIKILPFKGVNNFSVQSSFLFSPSTAPEGRSATAQQSGLYWIEWDRYVWWNQFFYTYTFGADKYQLFAELDLLFRFARRDGQVNHLDLPANIFLSYFPTKKITLYAMTQYVPRFAGSPVYDDNGNNITNDFVIGAHYTASGLGFKYQFSPVLNLELLYTNFWEARNNGLGETFNLGLKYLVL